MRKALGNASKALSVMRRTWKKLTSPPLSERNRRKARFLELHKHELPTDVLKLLGDAGRQERNRLVNFIVTKNSKGKWRFTLDAPYIKESLRAEFVRWSPTSACGCMHWHRCTQDHCNTPSHLTTGLLAGTWTTPPSLTQQVIGIRHMHR